MKRNIIGKAKEFAELMHYGQKRKGGAPYITHPQGVVRLLKKSVDNYLKISGGIKK